MAYTVKKQIRQGLPQVGVRPYRQVHAHSTGNPNSTAQNEADYHDRRPVESGFFQYVVGNGIAIQTAPLNMGAYDVAGGWNAETYAAVELIESHKTREEFLIDYKIYCELLRDLAKQAGIPVTLDTSDLAGIKTHNYCTYNQPNNSSDHVDPIPYLAKWGISLEQFRKDLTSTTSTQTKIQTTSVTETKIEEEDDLDMTEFAFAYKSAIFYVTGSRMVVLQSGTEWVVLQSMYKQTHNGKAITALDWSNNAPTAQAYFGICDYGNDANFQASVTKDLDTIKKSFK